MIDVIAEAWGWTGIVPKEVVGENDFGNLIIKAIDGRYWRLCPEDLYCEVVANSRSELDTLSTNQDFLRDWYMTAQVEEAKLKLGALPEGRKYYMVTPGPLGGSYTADNFQSLDLPELVRLSGDIARQIKDLPDGSEISFKVVD